LATDHLEHAGNLQQARQTSPRARVRLIWAFAVRDLKARFTATSLGLVWTLIVPIATVIVYGTVFSLIFRAQAPVMGNGHEGVFALWFFVGLVSWNVFSQGAGTSLGSILGMGGMLQKVYIPSYVPVLSAAITVTLEKIIEAAVMLALLLAFLNVGWTWLLYPFIFIATAMFAAALGYLLAVANVYFRDTAQIFGIVMQLWFFLTPVMYPIEMIPEDTHGIPLRAIISLNPMTSFVVCARSVLYELNVPPTFELVYGAAWLAGTTILAVVVYRRWGRDVSEAI
jgi:ABC-type polysaccharide/polyol phosphate export permease